MSKFQILALPSPNGSFVTASKRCERTMISACHRCNILSAIKQRHIGKLLSSLPPTHSFRRTMENCPDIVLDEFAFRQFDDPNYSGSKLHRTSKECFMSEVMGFYEKRKAVELEFGDRPALVDGYAPFCKHLFMPNFVEGLLSSTLQIDESNEHLLRTRYEARTEKELPVLIRYFPASCVSPPVCKFLDLILYSRDQIMKENQATGKGRIDLEPAPWRLISIKAQDVPYETPMNPITMMRNSIIAEGGSGVPIDRKSYMASVEYWSKHAIIA